MIDRTIVRELIAKTPLILADLPEQGADWHVHYALFARAGATPAARRELAAHHGIIVDLDRLYTDLAV